MRTRRCLNRMCQSVSHLHWCSLACKLLWEDQETNRILDALGEGHGLEEIYKDFRSQDNSGSSVAIRVKVLLEIPGNLKKFKKLLQQRQIPLVVTDDVQDDLDVPSWTDAEWEKANQGFKCACGCDGTIPLRDSYRKKGIPRYLRNHNGKGKECSLTRKERISKALKGKVRDEAFKEACRVRMTERWKNEEYQKFQHEQSTKNNADPERKARHSALMKKWALDHPDHHKGKLAEINREWAKNNKERKVAAGKAGHMALAKMGKKGVSSLERRLEEGLRKAGLKYEAQWEHPTGVADFFVESAIAVFADGEYWHSSEKAQAKDARQNADLTFRGFKVLRFWGAEIESNLDDCIERIRLALCPPS